MIRSLTLAIALYSLALAAWSLASAARSRSAVRLASAQGRRHVPAVSALNRLVAPLAVLESALLLQAVLDLASPATRHHPPEQATHLGYLLTSVTLLPILAVSLRGEESRWSSAALAVGCVAVAVVSVRLQATHA